MKFDVIIMNPPFQSPERKGRGVCGSSTLWDKFARMGLSLLNKNGLGAFIHPSLWRKPNHELNKIIFPYLEYIEIHNENDGLKVFGTETRYDVYVVNKEKKTNETKIIGQDGQELVLDLSTWSFLPNEKFNFISKLIAKDNNERLNIINNSAYHTQRIDYMSINKDDKFCNPCIYTVPNSGIPKLWFSSVNNKGHFGIPKLVFSTGRPISVGFFLDEKGGYGLTQFSSGIVDTIENLRKIKFALEAQKFRKFCSSISVGKLEISPSVLSLFRKDFWKEFVNEDGTEKQ